MVQTCASYNLRNIPHTSMTSPVLETLEGYPWPLNLTHLHLGSGIVTSLRGIPPGLTVLYMGSNQIHSLEGIPPSVTHLALGTNLIHSLEGIPPSVTHLDLGTNIHLQDIPTSVIIGPWGRSIT